LSPSDEKEGRGGRPERSVTELAVELTIAWLKRVESTADGRDPKEVSQALDEFHAAIQRHHETEMDAKRDRERVPAH
jgi:hypothetical protein